MHTYLITIWQNNFSTNQQFTVTTDDPILWIVDRFGPDEFDDFACYKSQLTTTEINNEQLRTRTLDKPT